MEAPRLLSVLRAHANPANVAGMARYGINSKDTLGVPMPVLRKLAKEAGRSHELAAELWASGIHEARILATLIDDPARVTGRQIGKRNPALCAKAIALAEEIRNRDSRAARWVASDALRELRRRLGKES
jgi:3-methyladenine DNA glycosylase AlkD